MAGDGTCSTAATRDVPQIAGIGRFESTRLYTASIVFG